MKHLTESEFMDYIYDELSNSARKNIDSHLNSCTSCKNTLSEMGQTLSMIDTLPDTDSKYTENHQNGFSETYAENPRNGNGAAYAENLRNGTAPAYAENSQSASSSESSSSVELAENIKDESSSSISEVLTPEELAEYLKITLADVFDLLSDIPYINIAGRIRFRRESVLKWLSMREQNSLASRETPVYQDLSVKLWREVV